MADTTDQRAQDYAFVEVDFTPDPKLQLMFDGLKAHEELGRPFLYEVDLSSGTLRGNVSALVGSAATVWLYQAGADTPDRFLNGIVTRVVSAGLTGGAYRYRIEVRPLIWLLTRITDCRIFQKKSAFQIITQIFRDAGLSFDDKRQAGAGDGELEYCVQYRETTFDFVTRLMEQHGLYYFFKHKRDQHTLVLADDPNAHESVGDALPFQFDRTEYRTVDDHMWEWSTDLALHSGSFMFQDYNFETPSADLTAKTVQHGNHAHNDYEVYEYPGLYDQQPAGRRLTDLRMQEIGARRATYQGTSNSRKLHAGWKFRLSDYPDRALNREYLITRSEFTLSIAEGLSSLAQDDASGSPGELLDTYRVTVHAIPGDVPFRLPRRTPRPMIRGPQTARVVGQPGDEITTDKYGRIKVRFHWDRSDTPDEERTCWIRVAQPWAGASWGSLFIPRVGQEVVVEFLEGNPDRPLITGSVYNANVTVPYALPDNKTRTTIKSNSSAGGDGSNELRFEDKAGSEEVFFHAQKDYNKEVLNNETVKIHKDTTTTVETGNRSVTVSQGKDSLTVSTGDHTISVSAGKSSVTAAQSITLQVGANSVVVDTTGVTINGMKVDVQASATMSLSAALIKLN